MSEPTAEVYVTHPAVNGGVELHIDTAVGIKELNLGDLQQLSEIDDELKDLWLENLPEEVTINALTIGNEFARIMRDVKHAETAMVLRIVWPSTGVTISLTWVVILVGPPRKVGDFHMTSVALRKDHDQRRDHDRRIGF